MTQETEDFGHLMTGLPAAAAKASNGPPARSQSIDMLTGLEYMAASSDSLEESDSAGESASPAAETWMKG